MAPARFRVVVRWGEYSLRLFGLWWFELPHKRQDHKYENQVLHDVEHIPKLRFAWTCPLLTLAYGCSGKSNMGRAGYLIICTRMSKTKIATKRKDRTLAKPKESFPEKRAKPKNPATTASTKEMSANLINMICFVSSLLETPVTASESHSNHRRRTSMATMIASAPLFASRHLRPLNKYRIHLKAPLPFARLVLYAHPVCIGSPSEEYWMGPLVPTD